MRALRWLHFAGSKTPSLPGMHKAEGLMVTVIANKVVLQVFAYTTPKVLLALC